MRAPPRYPRKLAKKSRATIFAHRELRSLLKKYEAELSEWQREITKTSRDAARRQRFAEIAAENDEDRRAKRDALDAEQIRARRGQCTAAYAKSLLARLQASRAIASIARGAHFERDEVIQQILCDALLRPIEDHHRLAYAAHHAIAKLRKARGREVLASELAPFDADDSGVWFEETIAIG